MPAVATAAVGLCNLDLAREYEREAEKKSCYDPRHMSTPPLIQRSPPDLCSYRGSNR